MNVNTQNSLLNSETLAAIRWLAMPEGTPFPLTDIATPESSPRPETLLPAEVRQWDDALLRWSKSRCTFRERSWGSLTRLYVDHIEHAHQTGGTFAPDRETFGAILMALGFRVGDGFVSGLLLSEDAEAAQWMPTQLKPATGKRVAR